MQHPCFASHVMIMPDNNVVLTYRKSWDITAVYIARNRHGEAGKDLSNLALLQPVSRHIRGVC